jgi:hypothetical protein
MYFCRLTKFEFLMFTPGRIAFTIFFLIAFVILLVFAYRKDRKVTRIHFQKNYLLLLGIALIFSFLFLLVKFRHVFIK